MAGRLEPYEIVHFFLEMNSWYCDNDARLGFHAPINPMSNSDDYDSDILL